MISRIRQTWDNHPLPLILVMAAVCRLVAAIFARGWGMFDDHFLVIESAQSWVDHAQANQWLPSGLANHGPTGHLLLYPGLHYLLFSFLKLLGLTDPQGKMIVVRLLHGAYSLLTIILGYRIAEKLDGRSSARLCALLLAILWFMPWLSVRNLVEAVCVPCLMSGLWIMVRKEEHRYEFQAFLFSGLLFGLAADIRLQSILFPVGAGVVLLLSRRWVPLLGLATGTVAGIFLVLGIIDLALWGTPFAELFEYISLNIADKECFTTFPWYNYLALLAGILIPPVSLFFLFGAVKSGARYPLISIPALLFLVFHMIFVNRQERFILPVIPFVILLGVIGWNRFIRQLRLRTIQRKVLQGCWIFFWMINLLLLAVATVNYSKRSRAETMCYLAKYAGIGGILVADEDDAPELFPRFYLGQWPVMFDTFSGRDSLEGAISRARQAPENDRPGFILFPGNERLPERVAKIRESFPGIVYETTIEPGLIDQVLHRLNPINQNNVIIIYRNTDLFTVNRD